MKVNLGSGQAYMPGWVNVDASPDVKADIHLDAAEFVRQYGAQVEQVYMGHVLEHVMPGDSLTLLRLLNERLPAGTVISAVTPDMGAIWEAYKAGEIDSYQLNAAFIYSYVQPSHHVWCYDQESLLELFRRAGFVDAEPVDPHTWEPVFHKDGVESKWQTGVRATARGLEGEKNVAPPEVEALTWDLVEAEVARRENKKVGEISTQELLLHRLEELRSALAREADLRGGYQQGFDDAARQLEEARAEIRELREHGVTVGEKEKPFDPNSTRPAVLPTNAPVIPPPVHVDPAEVPTTLRGKVRKAVGQKLPEGSPRRRKAKAALDAYRETVEYGRRLKRTWESRTVESEIAATEAAIETMSYDTWLAGHRISADQVKAQKDWAEAVAKNGRMLTVQVLVLPGSGDLGTTLDSLVAQSWPAWTAAVCTPASIPSSWSDKRISNSAVDTGSVFDAANAKVVAEKADYVIVVHAGDTLEPDCLFTIASAVRRDPLLELLVWDDDVRDASGHRSSPHFRPSWSPEMLLGADYIGTAAAIRRTAWESSGGLIEKFGDSAGWNLLLSLDLTDERVFRSSRVLGSVTARRGPDPATATTVVQHHLDDKGIPATAELVDQVVRVRWSMQDAPKVTVVIPTRHNRKMLSTCLPSLARTDYPDFHVVIVDNGGHSADNERWYEENKGSLDLKVIWWTETPFNYSAVNNAGAAAGDGEVLVFLNDDTELLDPTWMQELVGWARRPEIGVAGLQLIGPDDEIQHTGVILGLGGFADHIFEGTRPHEDSIFGRNDWYRNSLAVTGACMAMTRDYFDEVGGMDERFILCGSDVAIGLDSVLRGYRNVCSPFGTIRHLESATRGTNVPHWDFFMSFWRYSSWLFGGDPYFSPNVSLSSRIPEFRSAAEPTPQQRVSIPLGRSFEAFRQTTTEAESKMLSDMCRALPIDEAGVNDLHARNAEPFDVKSINWFIPDIDSPFYGGINTALRIADELARVHGVQNRFVVWGGGNENFVRSALASAFPALQHSEIVFYTNPNAATLQSIPYADVSIATLWVTAYAVTHMPNTKRKFYLIQDFEPMFYPASTLYSLAEETYKLGLYGLCNTDNLRKIYADEYGGKGMSFTPAVDPAIFHARGREERVDGSPVTLFVYGRPGHWRNCWEMAALALEELKDRLGDRVRIVTAGAWAQGGGAEMEIKRLGLLDYRATGELYRHCDVGLALTVSKHPSYLPLELMACGVPIVAFDNPWGYWILEDGKNSLLAKRTVDSLVDRLEKAVVDTELRRNMQAAALESIAARHNDWSAAISPIYPYLCDPEGKRG
ncbi:glycosyltransferase [Nakamurella sp. YIM 132087]|uniref:Glycosyltransferase n=1 Tax=Nakamurella alba TaxID=2665158 RepID=A0A7K1FL72_9ACTN|nr:glycosyltransferase [Nakamurella alba]MTD14129.1 glycosyltransferase [Nakamurella alba]